MSQYIKSLLRALQHQLAPPQPASDTRQDFTKLENRELFSAAPLELDLDSLQGDSDLGFDFAEQDHAATSDHWTNSDDLGHLDLTVDWASFDSSTALEAPTTSQDTQLVVVDSRVDDMEQLLAGIETDGAAIEVLVLDESVDGIEQITEKLPGLSALSAVHLVSHGDSDAVFLGSTVLTHEDLEAYSGQISQWQKSLASDADLLLYGCDLASSDDGQALIESLSMLCDCDVAASNDATGHSEMGGDWEFEYVVGVLEQNAIFSLDVQQTWLNTLATVSVTTTADVVSGDADTSSISGLISSPGSNGEISLREAIIAANADLAPDTITLAANTYDLFISGQGEDFATTGDLDIRTEITITGAGAEQTIIDGSMSDRIFDVLTSSGSLTLDSLTVRGGDGEAFGGGAVHVATASNTLEATDVVFRDNTTDLLGGAVYTFGNTTLDRVSIINNATNDLGGGISIGGGVTSVTNSTISGNQSIDHGGGIHASSGIIDLDHSTVASYITTTGRGGGVYRNGGTITISNSIFADNTSLFTTQNSDIDGTVLSNGHNVVEDSNPVFLLSGSDIQGVDPGLSELVLDATSGQYIHAINSSSVASDGAIGSTQSNDQRGFARDASPDIGAFDLGLAPGTFWISTTGDVTGSVAPGLSDWDDQDIIQVADPNLTFESGDGTSGTSNGTFTEAVDFNSFAGVSADTDAIHRVEDSITFFGVNLQPGDLLFSNTVNLPYTSNNSVNLNPGNVHLFRPDNPNDYSTGTFTQNVVISSGLGVGSITGFTLVETDTIVGGRSLSAGDFLFVSDGLNVLAYDTSDSTSSVLLDASGVGIDSAISAVELIESPHTIGGSTFDPGTLLLTLNSTDASVGSNGIPANNFDVVALDLVSTGTGTTAGTASVVFDGSDVGLATAERFDALALTEEKPRLDQGLVGHFRLNQGVGLAAVDSSATANNGSFNNSPTWTTESADGSQAIDFAGDAVGGNTFVTVPDNVAYDFDIEDFSVALWYRMRLPTEDVHLVGNHDGLNSSAGFRIVATATGRVEFERSDGTFFGVAPIDAPFDGQWHHLTVSVDGGEAKLYVDGVEQLPLFGGGAAIDVDTTSPITIGAVNAAVDDFEGQLDDIRIYSRTLDAAEALQLASTANDLSFDLSTGVSINTDGGNDAYLVADNGGDILGEATAFTFETTFTGKPSATETPLISYAAGASGGDDLYVNIDDTGQLIFFVAGSSDSSNALDYNTLLDGQKHSLALKWDNVNGDWAVYVDGQLRDSGTGLSTGVELAGSSETGELVFGNDQDTIGGGFDPSQSFHGTFYDVRIWNNARSHSEIALNYQQKYDPTNLPGELVANWQFDGFDGDGDIVELVAGNNLNVAHATTAGFLPSDPIAGLNVDENSSDGTNVGDVVATGQSSKLVSDVLASDPSLVYDASTTKFYKAIEGDFNWTDANAAATSTLLSGAAGQLVTVRSQYENDLVQLLASSLSNPEDVWMGASDQNSEGDWHWYVDGVQDDGDLFWIGDNLTGSAQSGAYTNWKDSDGIGEPNADAPLEDYGRLTHDTGEWRDTDLAVTTYSYVIEWDAREVLNGLSFALTHDANGRFTIDSTTGEVSVADGSQLNHEANPIHGVTVAITDAAGRTYAEDFSVTINDANDVPTFDVPVTPTFTENAIATTDGAISVETADVDGDGDLDVLSAGFHADTFGWHENDGNGSFTTHNITTTANGARSIKAADLDGDGDMDLITAAVHNNTITWFENDGRQSFTARTITNNADGAISVSVADIDRDGDLDVVAASGDTHTVEWYENDGSQSFTAQTIATNVFGVFSIVTADVDRDGDLDVVSAAEAGDTVAWHENDGSQNFTVRTITTTAVSVRSVKTADVDGDGDLDVLSASFNDDTIAWYENDGSQNFTVRTITTGANGAMDVSTADVDGDGDLDVISASHLGDTFDWYENDGSQNFTARALPAVPDGAYDVTTGDLDGDGDPDIVSAAFQADAIAWFDNDGGRFNTLDGNPTFVEDGAPVPLDADVQIFDAELSALNGGSGDFGGATLTLERASGANGDDDFSSVGPLGFGATDFFLSGVKKGTYTGSPAGRLSFTFDPGVTNADVNQVMQSIAYGNTNDTPPASVDIVWTFDDGNGGTQGVGGPQSVTGVTTVAITPNDDPASFINLDASPTFTEGGAPVVLDADVEIFDPELTAAGDFGGSTFFIRRSGGAQAEDTFSPAGNLVFNGTNLELSGTMIGTVAEGAGSTTLNFQAGVSNAQVNEALQSIAYSNSSVDPPASVAIRWAFSDGNQFTAATSTVDITATNDAPTWSNRSGSIGYTENGAPEFLHAAITVNDVDSANFDGGQLRAEFLTNGTNTDWLRIVPDANVTLQGTDVLFGGTIIGSYSGGHGTDDLLIDLNANANAANVTQLARRIAFANTSDNHPSSNIRSARFFLQDGDGSTSAPANLNIGVFGVPDAPIARDDLAALHFDGIDDVLVIADDPTLQMTNTLTMEAWFNTDTIPSAEHTTIINKEGEYEIGISTTGTLVWGFDNVDPDWTWHDTGFDVTAGQWTHVAVTYDNGLVTTYVNGNLADVYHGSGTIGDHYPALNDLLIGGRLNNPADNYFDGEIDDVRVWNTAQTQAQIQANLDAQLTGSETGLVGSWRFDEGAGLIASDSSTAANTGTLTDGGAGQAGPQWTGFAVSADGSFNLNASVGPLANDIDSDGDSLSVINVDSASTLGTVVINGIGGISYDPDGAFDNLTAGQTAFDTVTYTVGDGNGNQDTATVSIRIDGVSNAPVVDLDANDSSGTTGLDYDATFVVGDGPVAIADGPSLFDVDGTIQTLTIQITNIQDGADEVLYYINDGVTASVYTPSIGRLVYSNVGASTHAHFLNLLNSVTYDNVSATPNTTNRLITVIANDGLADSATATTTITVSNDSSAPSAVNNTVSNVIEGGTDPIQSSELEFSDAQPSSSINYTVTTPTTNGFLAMSATPTVPITSFTQADIDAGDLIYVHDSTETTTDSFTFTVDDSRGNSTVGQTFSIAVTPVNDAPVLLSGTMRPTTITEDDIANSGNLISDIILSGGPDRITDVDGPAEGLAIYSTSSPRGTWQHSNDGGTNWQDMGTVSATSSLLLRDIDRVRFVPDGEVGTSPTLIVRAWDQSSGTSGSRVDTTSNGSATPFSSSSTTVRLTVTDVNDAPVLTTNGMTVLENSNNNVILNAMLNGVDVDDAPPELTFRITANVNDGALLRDNGATPDTIFAVGGTFTQQDIDDGLIRYWHLGNENPTDSFDVELFDGGEDGVGSQTGTFTISITNVNDAPTIDLDEDDSSGATGLDFDTTFIEGFGPIAITDGALLQDVDSTLQELRVTIANAATISLEQIEYSLPNNITVNQTGATPLWTFTNTGSATNADFQTLLNSLQYNNTIAGASPGLRNITVVANDGAADSLVATANVDVQRNFSPSVAENNGSTVTEGGSDVIDSNELTFADDYSPDTSLTYNVTSDPSNGHLALVSDPTSPITSFTQAQINAAQIVFVHDGGESAADSFSFDITDGHGNATTDQSFAITVANQNDAPFNAGGFPAVHVHLEDGISQVNLSPIILGDADAGSGDLTITISAAIGNLRVSEGLHGGITVDNNQNSVAVTGTLGELNGWLNDLLLDYETSVPNGSGGNFDQLTVSVTDNGNTGSGGAIETALGNIQVDVVPVNDAPVQTGGVVTSIVIDEDTVLNPLGFAGLTHSPGGGPDEGTQTLTYNVTVIPSSFFGTVYLADGVTAVSTGTYSQADIQGMVFTPTAESNTTSISFFEFQVVDDGGVDNGGADRISHAIQIDITPVNDAPTISNLDADVLHYAAGDGAVQLDQAGDALVTDVDSTDFDGGILRVAFDPFSDSIAEDVLSIQDAGSTAVVIGFNSATGEVTYGGASIGIATGGNRGTGLNVALSANADANAVSALVQSITFENTDTPAPTAGSRTVQFLVDDGDGATSLVHSVTVNVNGQNVAPLLTDNLGAPTAGEGGGAVIFQGATVTDIDSVDFDGGSLTVTVANSPDTNHGLYLTNLAGVTTSVDNVFVNGLLVGTSGGGEQLQPPGRTGPLAINFNANATRSDVQSVLQAVSILNNSQDPTVGPRTVEAVITDGDGGTSNTLTKDVPFTAQNDAPLLNNSGTLHFTNITEDDVSNSGNSISEIFGATTLPDLITDIETSDPEGMAVTGFANSNGTWQYSIDAGASWIDAPTVSDTTALLLRTTDRLRYVPDGIRGESAQITFRAWDQSSGTAGTLADASSNGGATAFSVSSETAEIIVQDVNDAPTAADDDFSVSEDTPLSGEVSLNDFDADGVTTFVPQLGPSNGMLLLTIADGSFTYTPNANFTGSDSFTYRVTDDNGAFADATVNISVSPVNDAPEAINDNYWLNSGTSFTTTLGVNDLLTNDIDIDGDTLALNTTPIVGPANGTLVLNTDGTFTYTPNLLFAGFDSFTYEITDGNGATAQATVSLAVADNSVPIAVGDTYATVTGGELVVSTREGLLLNDYDPEGVLLTATLVTPTSNGTLTLELDGSFSYVPETGFIGTDLFAYAVSDGVNQSVAYVEISVLPAPIQPTTPTDPGGGDDYGSGGGDPVPEPPPTEPEDVDEDSGEDGSGLTLPALPTPLGDAPHVLHGGEQRAIINDDIEGFDELVFTTTLTNPTVTQTVVAVAESITSRLHTAAEAHLEIISESIDVDLVRYQDTQILWEHFDAFRERVDDEVRSQQVAIGAATAIASTATLSYMMWTLRGGYLLATLVSSAPAWRVLDPIRILPTAKPEEEKNNDASLADIIRTANGEGKPSPVK